jgi:hypothetical protein
MVKQRWKLRDIAEAEGLTTDEYVRQVIEEGAVNPNMLAKELGINYSAAQYWFSKLGYRMVETPRTRWEQGSE